MPAAMDAARPAGSRRAAAGIRSRRITSRKSRTTSRARCIPCIVTRPSSRPHLRSTIEQDYQEEPQYAEEPIRRRAQQADPSRYDDALYGQIESGQQEYQRDPAYPDDPYAYQSDYEEEPEPQQALAAA